MSKLHEKMKEKAERLRKKANKLGIRFHGRREESLIRIRKKGLEAKKTQEGHTYFGNAEAADGKAYSSGKKWSVVHSVSKGYLEQKKKEGKVIGEDKYAGFEEKQVFFDIPSKDIKTFVMRREGDSFKEDPIMANEEGELNKKGYTMKEEFEEHPKNIHHKINYYNMILTEEDYEKHKTLLQKEAEERLKKKGKISYGEMREVTKKLRIPEDIQDEVIARVFLDLNLKKTKEGFKR